MKTYKYAAIFYPDDGAISVEFPDLSGCLTYGDDIDHAFDMAKEAMGGWLATYLENNPAPKSTPLPDVIAKFNNGEYDDPEIEREPGGFVLLLELNPIYLKDINNKCVRVNTTMPAWMKAAAEKQGINISKILQTALMRELNNV